MTALDWYGLAGLGLVLLAFCFVRNIAAYVRTCALIVLSISAATVHHIMVGESLRQSAEGLVLIAGNVLFAFGLLIVRVMFIRSVSLNMLRSMQTGADGSFGEDIGGRLGDMRSFRL